VTALNQEICVFCQPDDAFTGNGIPAGGNDLAFRLNSVPKAAPFKIRNCSEIAMLDIIGSYLPLIGFRLTGFGNEPLSL